MKRISPNQTLWFLVFFSLAALCLMPFIGMHHIGIQDISQFTQTSDGRIFWLIRVPRILLGFLAGAALSVSGMTFQALFRNPLATPFTLGVSSGASLGAAVFLTAGFQIPFISGLSIASFLGALLAVLLVYGLSKLRKDFTTYTLLLAGVAVSFFFSSLILLLQYLSEFTQIHRIVRWLMGGLEVTGYQVVANLSIMVLIGCVIIVAHRHELNLLLTGDEMATSRGANVQRIKTLLFFSTSLMIGGVVSVCGPIGFIGMMAPHMCRLVIGSDHAYLTPASLLFGGIFLMVCDTIARSVVPPVEIPVGIITALLGGPFFIWLLLSQRTRHWF